MRIGAKKRPFYRVVAVDERAKRTGAYLELLGTYNPLTHPHEINLKQDRIDYWVKQGAKMSDGFLRIIGKAPQRPPRKPKKTKAPQEEKTEEATEVKSDAASRLSEAGESGGESTSSDVHEPARAGSEPQAGSEEAELEKQDQTNEGAAPDERPT